MDLAVKNKHQKKFKCFRFIILHAGMWPASTLYSTKKQAKQDYGCVTNKECQIIRVKVEEVS